MRLRPALTPTATFVPTKPAPGTFKCSEITVSGEKREVFKDNACSPYFAVEGGLAAVRL